MKSNVNLPNHIAIIMDGNGRWAKNKSKPRIFGHNEGVATIERISDEVFGLGIKNLTLYAFSTENWNRPEEEVKGLFDLMKKFIKKHSKNLLKKNIKLRIFGSRDRLDEKLISDIENAEEATKDCTAGTLGICFNYGGRGEIVDAVNNIIKNAIDNVTEETFSNYLYTGGISDPDIVIRTGGDKRLSNFLLYQCAYAELHFVDTLWPDFGKEDLHKILDKYSKTERRFGSVKL